MKKLIIVLLMLLMVICFASPVLASDPPGMDVDIVVSTPGDVDMGIGIDAGGDVNVTVDGVDFQSVAGAAYAAYQRAFGNTGALSGWEEWYANWLKMGGDEIILALVNHENALDMLATSQVGLIQHSQGAENAISAISQDLTDLDDQMKTTTASLKAQDDVTWNQLMYGAESHIDWLTIEHERQEMINQRNILIMESYRLESQASIVYLQHQLDSTVAYNEVLVRHIDRTNLHNTFWLWLIVAGFVLVLSVMAVLTIRLHRIGNER